MKKEIEAILAKHGCLHMKDDYKALFDELGQITGYSEKDMDNAYDKGYQDGARAAANTILG